MKKKSTRDIPDFSRHPTQVTRGAHGSAPQAQTKVAPPAQPRPTVAKPPATSAKSGRRGQ